MAPSRHDWKIVDWDVKPQHNQPTHYNTNISLLTVHNMCSQILAIQFAFLFIKLDFHILIVYSLVLASTPEYFYEVLNIYSSSIIKWVLGTYLSTF